jgi:hypothetical protein
VSRHHHRMSGPSTVACTSPVFARTTASCGRGGNASGSRASEDLR